MALGAQATAVLKTAEVLILSVSPTGSGSDEATGLVRSLVKDAPVLKRLWLICATEDEAEWALARQGDGEWSNLEIHTVDGGQDPDGVVGDLLGLQLGTGARIATLDLSGGAGVGHALRRGSGYAGVPLLSVDPMLTVFVDHPQGVTPSLLLGALRLSLMPKVKQPSITDLRARGYDALLKVSTEVGYSRTALLDHLLLDDDLARASDYSSACADLLERRGHLEDARRFREATRFWMKQRLWDVNFVPEMVLHNEAHSAGVDRNIASLCEPLLEQDVIDDVDLLVLACAAWLHDWGHASVGAVGMTLRTDPVYVRRFHGVFSQTLIRHKPQTHQLDERFSGKGLLSGVYEENSSEFADDVGLLCAHHQGWTSCDGRVPPEAESEPSLGISSFHQGYEEAVKSRQSYRYLTGRGFLPPGVQEVDAHKRDRARAELRLALLRVADAADLGVHRVPNYLTQHHARALIADAYLEREGELIELALDDHHVRDAEVRLLRKAISSIREVAAEVERVALEKVRGGGSLEERDFGELFKSALRAPHDYPWLEDPQRLPPDMDGKLVTLRARIQSAYEYAKHVVAQRVYYDQHEMVRAAIPILESVDDKLRLVLHVVPNRFAIDPEERERRAEWFVRHTVAREWGSSVDVATHEEFPTGFPDDHKRPIANYLQMHAHLREVLAAGAMVPRGAAPVVPEITRRREVKVEVQRTVALPRADGGWLVGRRGKVEYSKTPLPEVGSSVVGSTLDGVRIAVVTPSGSLWLHNTALGGSPNEYAQGQLTDMAVLALGPQTTVLLATAKGAQEFDYLTKKVTREFVAPEDAPFVKGFFVAGEPLLLDQNGGVHWPDPPFPTSQVVDLDLVEAVGHVWWAAVLHGEGSKLLVVSSGGVGTVQPQQVPSLAGLNGARVLWERGAKAGPPLLTVVTDSGAERHQILPTGSVVRT